MNVKGVQCCVVLFLMQNEGSVQDMRRNLIIKAFVLGAVGCTFTITGMAANGHGQGIADSTTEVNEAKHEAVRSKLDGSHRYRSRRWYERFERDA